MKGCNDMNYKNIKVDAISMIIELEEEIGESWEDTEDYILDLLEKNKIEEQLEVDNPIDNLVYLQPLFLNVKHITKESVELLSNAYKKVQKIFSNVKISLHLDGFLEHSGSEFNEIDLTLEEFRVLFYNNAIKELEKPKTNNKYEVND